jgi:hypothetical protein
MDEKNTIAEMLDRSPLIGFSVYTQFQFRTLSAVGREILDLLDSSMAEGSADAQALNRAYGMFWLWLLGAYEITRTMCQAKPCFTAELSTKLIAFKNGSPHCVCHSPSKSTKGERLEFQLGPNRRFVVWTRWGRILSLRSTEQLYLSAI